MEVEGQAQSAGQGQTDQGGPEGQQEESLGPRNILIALLPPEVVADETPAVQAVLRADTKRLKLLEEEHRLQGQLEQGDDTAAERLEKVEEKAQGTHARAQVPGPSDMCPLLPLPRYMRNCGLPGRRQQRPKRGGSWLAWALTLRCRIGPHRSSRGDGACVSPWPGGPSQPCTTRVLSLLPSLQGPDSLSLPYPGLLSASPAPAFSEERSG